MFEDVATIWFELICASTAAIEINVDQGIYRALQDASYANAAERTGYSLVNPWESEAPITPPERDGRSICEDQGGFHCFPGEQLMHWSLDADGLGTRAILFLDVAT